MIQRRFFTLVSLVGFLGSVLTSSVSADDFYDEFYTVVSSEFTEFVDGPKPFCKEVPSGGLLLSDTDPSSRIFGGAIKAGVKGPAYSTPPAAWAFEGKQIGFIVNESPAVAMKFFSFLEDGHAFVLFFSDSGRLVKVHRISPGRSNADGTTGNEFVFRRPVRFALIISDSSFFSIDSLTIVLLGGTHDD